MEKNAFNMMSRESVISSAVELGVPRQIVRLLAAYLSDRVTIVKWGSERSTPRPSLAGCGQGTGLSVLLFLLTMNVDLVRLRQKIQALEGQGLTTLCMAFIDDVSLLHPYDPADMEDPMSGDRVFSDDGRLARYLQVIEEFNAETARARLSTSHHRSSY